MRSGRGNWDSPNWKEGWESEKADRSLSELRRRLGMASREHEGEGKLAGFSSGASLLGCGVLPFKPVAAGSNLRSPSLWVAFERRFLRGLSPPFLPEDGTAFASNLCGSINLCSSPFGGNL